VRVGEARGKLDFAEEPVRAEARGDFGTKHLQRHAAVVLQIAGQEHHGHAALAELALNVVARRERDAEASG